VPASDGMAGARSGCAIDYKGEGKPATTSPPGDLGNIVALGAAVQDNMYRNSLDGIVRGFDVVTGRQLWYMEPDPRRSFPR